MRRQELQLPPWICHECGGMAECRRTKKDYQGRVYRRLRCTKCGEPWTTWEMRLAPDLVQLAEKRGLKMDGVTSNHLFDDI